MRLWTLLAVVVLCGAPRPAGAQPTVIDSAGVVGAGSDVAYGADGRALVSYLDATNGALKVAACLDAACHAADLHTIDASGAVTGSTSIAIGADGLARIGYQAGTAVRIARCANAACSTAALATVDTFPGLGPGTAIGIGGDGLPIVGYGALPNGMRVAHCDDASCGAVTVTSYPGYPEVSLTVGGDGRALIGTYDGSGNVRIHHCVDLACTATTVGSIFGVPSGGPQGHSFHSPSLATRPDGTGIVAVTRLSNVGPPRTELYRCVNASCANPASTPFAAGASGSAALAVTADDRVVLAYYGGVAPAQQLQAMTCASGYTSCHVRTLDAVGIGRQPEVGVSPAGVGLVSYQDEVNGDLKVAWLGGPPPLPFVTTLDAAGDVGRESDVAFGADGRGFVAYVDTTNGGLKIASCTDLACTAADLRTIDADGPVAHASVAIGAGGRPTIAYQHVPTASVRVARCADPTCTSAGIVTLDDVSALTAGTDIAIGADTFPFVVYGDAGTDTLKVAHCHDPACASRTITPHPDAGGLDPLTPPAALLGPDGLALFASSHGNDLRLGHCSDPACTSATFTRLVGSPTPPNSVRFYDPALTLGSDGRPVLAYVHEQTGAPSFSFDVKLRRCVDAACSALEPTPSTIGARSLAPSIGMAPGNLPVVSVYGELTPPSPKLLVTRCTTPACSSDFPTAVDGPVTGHDHSMAVDGLGRALVSYYDESSRDLKVAWLGLPAEVSVGDVAVVEGTGGTTVALLPVTVSQPTSARVNFATAPGTATAPGDYVATSGTLTFTPSATTLYVTVSVVPDADVEPHETFFVNLSFPLGVTIADGQGQGTILDDDSTHGLRVEDTSAAEGAAGPGNVLSFPVVLDGAVPAPVTVQYATENGSATAGFDYLPTSGTLTFAPGALVQQVSVVVVGDVELETDETVVLRLSNPQNATILDGEGVGTIVDDDGASEGPPPGELTHGASYRGELAAVGGTPDVDDFRFAQDPYASYEVVVDALSGDAVPLLLERRDSGGGVLQSGTVGGTGSAVSLRWIVAGTAPVTSETVRIAGDCGTSCGADDVYRIRAYETTLRAARFNNSGPSGQTTVLLLQNRTDDPVSAVVRFWSPLGNLIATHVLSAPIQPHGLLVLDTSTVAPLTSGAVTVAHDAPYGGVAGKAVALDVPTGFSFDTPLEPRPR